MSKENTVRTPSICAVVPAAGRGTRLGENVPKAFVPIAEKTRVWDVLSPKLSQVASHRVLVVSEEGAQFIERWSREENPTSLDAVEICVQQEPKGTGDAIFAASSQWNRFEHLLVVWGDQIHVSADTLRRVVQSHLSAAGPRWSLALTWTGSPYAHYDFDAGLTTLKEIRMQREGVEPPRFGWSDTGLFCLTTQGLEPLWRTFLTQDIRGDQTGEINFLPFLAFLSREAHWKVNPTVVEDPLECRGINSKDDLDFFRNLYSKSIEGGA